MELKKIILIAGTEHTRSFLHMQLQEYLRSFTEIESYAIDDGMDNKLKEADLYIFSSKIVMEELKLEMVDIPYVIATRTINYSNIDKLFFLPKGSDVLFVNDIKETTYECIDNLIGLEVNHLRYFPYYPGVEEYKRCEIAVTPGEVDKIPREVKTIIDLGCRPLDMGTLIEIMHKLGYYDENVTDISLRYVKKIIELGKRLAVKNNEVITLNRDLERIIIDINGLQNRNEDESIMKFKYDGTNRELRDNIFKKRYYAKYNFEDILGESPNIIKTKEFAKKIARTDLSVLIEGECGTGKELFASAIHNASKRKDGPFLPVNFSAIPESLMESELFGYEDGAFTGARKGGKVGYFEQANGGTIFLDEIGDASPAVQARLLRVLQEKELMRIGGDRLIPLDLRIIAATNKNLKKLISEGKFREDLYYRIKMAYILIPTLRERKRDVTLISKKYIENTTNLTISNEVLVKLQQNEWRGNVRELINTLDYVIAVCDEREITLKYLPMDFIGYKYDIDEEDIVEDTDTFEILNSIYESQQTGSVIGRKTLVENLCNKGLLYTEQSIRAKLNALEGLGLIKKSKGRFGTKLTEYGIRYIGNNQ